MQINLNRFVRALARRVDALEQNDGGGKSGEADAVASLEKRVAALEDQLSPVETGKKEAPEETPEKAKASRKKPAATK